MGCPAGEAAEIAGPSDVTCRAFRSRRNFTTAAAETRYGAAGARATAAVNRVVVLDPFSTGLISPRSRIGR
jgi:uncharacterized protein (DUF3084 family)